MQKVTLDIGNKVEDEIFKLSSIFALPEAFDVLLIKDGNSGMFFLAQFCYNILIFHSQI